MEKHILYPLLTVSCHNLKKETTYMKNTNKKLLTTERKTKLNNDRFKNRNF